VLLGVPASTVGAVLRRAGLPHLSHADRVTGELLRGRQHSDRRTSTTGPARCCTSTLSARRAALLAIDHHPDGCRRPPAQRPVMPRVATPQGAGAAPITPTNPSPARYVAPGPARWSAYSSLKAACCSRSPTTSSTGRGRQDPPRAGASSRSAVPAPRCAGVAAALRVTTGAARGQDGRASRLPYAARLRDWLTGSPTTSRRPWPSRPSWSPAPKPPLSAAAAGRAARARPDRTSTDDEHMTVVIMPFTSACARTAVRGRVTTPSVRASCPVSRSGR
jgi:hypothetical protein